MKASRISPKTHSLSLAAVAIGWLAISGVSGADLYRCVRADGSTVYTDSQARCPGAKAHQPSGAVQQYRSTSSLPSASQPAARRAAKRNASRAFANRTQNAGREIWRRKKHETTERLSQIATRIETLLPYITICNRGGALYRTQENGLRTGVSCNSLRAELPKLKEQRTTLQAYLDHGLSEECRKSGCLPGWLR